MLVLVLVGVGVGVVSRAVATSKESSEGAKSTAITSATERKGQVVLIKAEFVR